MIIYVGMIYDEIDRKSLFLLHVERTSFLNNVREDAAARWGHVEWTRNVDHRGGFSVKSAELQRKRRLNFQATLTRNSTIRRRWGDG